MTLSSSLEPSRPPLLSSPARRRTGRPCPTRTSARGPTSRSGPSSRRSRLLRSFRPKLNNGELARRARACLGGGRTSGPGARLIVDSGATCIDSCNISNWMDRRARASSDCQESFRRCSRCRAERCPTYERHDRRHLRHLFLYVLPPGLEAELPSLDSSTPTSIDHHHAPLQHRH